MYKENINFYKIQANILKAISNPIRLFIINELKDKELCVNEISKLAGYDTSTISKHLSVLKNAGLISDSKQGLKVYYRLKMPCILDMLTCVNKTVKEVAEDNLKNIKRE